MKKPMVRIYTDNDVFVDREMTTEEFAQYEIDQAQIVAENQAIAERAESRKAVFAKLGLTPEEVALIF
jgi:hypothetical protein